jgi:hypothetical protein
VPYLKFSRDKRGYEHFSIIEPGVSRRGKPPRPRLLFWFRTPPQVKVGRLPFTDDVRRAIEAQNPGVRFDWPRILSTPIPPADAEHWRERRRIEKAAKQAAREAESAEPGQEEVQEVQALQDVNEPGAAEDLGPGEDDADQTVVPLQASDSGEPVPAAGSAAGSERATSGRRRRRRGRRRHRPASETAVEQPAPIVPVPPTDEV